MFETNGMTQLTKKEIKSTKQYRDFGATLLQTEMMQNATNSLQNKKKRSENKSHKDVCQPANVL